MKLSLPITPKYVWPVMFGLLLLDSGVALVAWSVLSHAAERARVVRVDGLQCLSYAPTVWGSVYLVARCAPTSKQ